MKSNLPTRELREHPDLDQLKRQAKELFEAFLSGEPAALAEVGQHYRDPIPATFALHGAQLVVARAYGFASWPKLKAYVEGVNARRLREAVAGGDLLLARSMLRVRPELAREALLEAVLARSPEMVRLLMQHGANARSGVYPHRDATSPLTIAIERGYHEIVAIIRDSEQHTPEAENIFQAVASGDAGRVLALLHSDPKIVYSRHPRFGLMPLHVAAKMLSANIAGVLLDHGADVAGRGGHDLTPLDLAAQRSGAETAREFAALAALLIARGAVMTSCAAVALGDADWLRARHAEGVLMNPIEDSGGLLRIAVSHNRSDILALLLDFGFDPDERIRFEAVGVDDVAFTWGMPLWHCAGSGKHEMAEMLLRRGADPNASVYASGDPVFQAYSQQDWEMVRLLERYGGVPEASTAGLYRERELAAKMLSGEAKYRLAGDGDQTMAEQLLWGAACGGDPEIVRMALDRVDWPHDDARWFHILEQPLRIWSHGSGGADWDRSTYLACLRLLLERCDPNLRGREGFGLTILHSIAGSREHVTADERVAFATMLLDAGARLDLRDQLLQSTPLGWACRWGRVELVKLFLERGADPIEADAEPWATPRAWAEKMGHQIVLELLL